MTPIQTIVTSLITSLVMFAIGFFVTNVWYQGRKDKKAAKTFVFTQILAAQAFLDYAKVKALNSIEIVFYDCPEIIKAWRDYKKSLRFDGDAPTQQEIETIKKTEKLLLEKMAKNLGYKNITWDTVDDPYYPKWIAEDERSKQTINRFVEGASAWMQSQGTGNQRNGFTPPHGKGKKGR